MAKRKPKASGIDKRKPKKGQSAANGSRPDYTKAELRAIYDKVRREFTAADLQKYTEIDEQTIPARQLLAELKATHKADLRKRKKA
jgi:hypothetical protein